MTIKEKSYIAKELLRLPDYTVRREMVEVEIRTITPAGNEHGYIAGEIFAELRSYVKANDMGRTYTAETGFKIVSNPDAVRAPDAAFVSRERLEEAGNVEGFWPGAPDLAVQVVSPGDTHAEVLEKSLAWLDAGCQMVSVVEPKRKVVTGYRSREDIHILAGDEVVDGADVVPGWQLPISKIFA